VDSTKGQLRVGACLSLSGRFAPFGQQAARGLAVWAELDGNAEVLIEDDASEVRKLKSLLPGVAARCDLLLGPYSTVLMRAAGDMAAENGWLIWNHGGSGDDVETAHPGHIISALTPTSRYMEPFLDHLAAEMEPDEELRIAHGKGQFGRQVASGAESFARQLGFTRISAGRGELMLAKDTAESWVLITAGTFEDDIVTVQRAQSLLRPPRAICAIAAGVREFRRSNANVDGVFGIAQWFRGDGYEALLGPGEREVLAGYSTTVGNMPDYPAIQAVATASLAAHCARQIGSVNRADLWRAATTLETRTLYGAFKVDQTTGAQIGHTTVLTRWVADKLIHYAEVPK
jgi:hypothetical protein